MKYIYFFAAFSFTTLTSVAHDAAYLIAQKYGLQNWNKVESITYTFNVKNPRAEFGRTWTWHPKEDKVYSHADDISYTRGEGMDEKIDKNFINDVFWLLFPFQIVWDPTLTFEEEENDKDDGYTPGDVYELFYDEDYNITAWIFLRGGKGEGRATVWKDNQEFNGITISTEHRNPEGGGLWFSDIEVTLK